MGELRAQLQELGTGAAQMGTTTTHAVTSMSTTEHLMKAQLAHTIVIPAEALITENEKDRVVVGQLTGLGLNLATLLCESLYQL